LRLIEFSADQLGEVYQFTMPRPCSLSRDAVGQLYESSGSDCIYFAGRYFRGADCIAYRIYERTNAWYGNPQIYDANDVIYFRDPASFRGVRGVTKFANALQHMQKGEDMLQAALSSAQRQARTAGRVFNNSGGPADGYGSEVMTGDPALGGNTIKYFEREPGGPMIEYFYNGDSAEFVNPTAPGPELIAGVETSDERVAISLGLNYAFLISATKVGGAPSRLEIEKADKEIQRIQRTIHRPRLNTIRDRVLMDALHRGIIRKPFGMPREQFLRGNWQLPISPSVDAFYDAKENISMVRAGMEAAQDVIAETNRNWEDVLEKNAQWAMKCSMVRQDANKQLIAAGYKPDITAADIAQNSDNPQQSAAAENIEQGKPAAGGSQPQATAQ
jgi:capsid protein